MACWRLGSEERAGERKRYTETRCSPSSRNPTRHDTLQVMALANIDRLRALDESSLSEVRGGTEEDLAFFLSKKGYDYYQASSDLAAAGMQNNPYFVDNQLAGEMV